MRKESDKKLFTVVTTFSGGGGSSVGYKLGGGKVLLMNEFIEEGVKTYLLNHPNTPHEMIDLRKVTRKGGRKYVIDWFKKFGISVGNYDILDGSPPCSTFSTSGKGQTKNEKKNVQYSETTQSRIGMLIHDFVYMVNCTKPKICIIENVPNIEEHDFTDVIQHFRSKDYHMQSPHVLWIGYGSITWPSESIGNLVKIESLKIREPQFILGSQSTYRFLVESLWIP